MKQAELTLAQNNANKELEVAETELLVAKKNLSSASSAYKKSQKNQMEKMKNAFILSQTKAS